MLFDSSDTRKFSTNLNELVLSNGFEVLATNSDVNLDTESLLLVPNQSVDSQDLQRSACSDDRQILSKSKQNDRNLAVGNIFDGKKSLNANIASPIDQDLTNDNVVVSVDAMDPAAHLDTMDSAINGSHTNQVDTMEFLPVECTEFEKCKQQIGLSFGCIPLSLVITYLGPDIQWEKIPNVIEAHTLIRASFGVEGSLFRIV